MSPAYLDLLESGELERRAEALTARTSPCVLCPRECRVDRVRGERGWCRAGVHASLVSESAHLGEEVCLSGRNGSGAIFLGHCNLRCVFCQNHQVSQDPDADRQYEVADERIADGMLQLQEKGCHNINWVSPTHQLGALARSLLIAARRGLRLPIVYNTNGYDSLDSLRLLDGIVDIYLPDLKYSSEAVGLRLSNVSHYVARTRAAILEMHRQVGDLQLDSEGIARRGLLIRHLILPEDLSGTAEALTWIAETLGRSTTVNLMSQYHPAFQAACDPRLTRGLTRDEYERATDYARGLGLVNLLTQPRFVWFV